MKKFLNTIYGRISIIFLLLLSLLGIVQILLFINFSSSYIIESDQKLNRNLAQDLANKFKPFLKDSIDYASIEHSFHEMMVMNPRVEFYLLDNQGKILAFFADPAKIKRDKVDLQPIKRFLAAGNNLKMPFYGDDPRGIDRKKPFSVTSINVGGEQSGYLYVILGGEEYDSALAMVKDSYILQTSAVALGINFILTALIGLLLFFLLTRRLRMVTRAVNNFAQGNYNSRIRFRSNDEIGQLLDSFNAMADTITANIEEIKNNDRLRRDLVANISHDLRSPLASVQGFLETILIKEDTLSTEERHRYLDTVYKNIQRLNNLVSELFELSKLDAKQVKPNAEPFSIAELTQDVVLKFKPQAEKSKIDIQSHFQSGIPMVEGDIAMIERALSNLIDNAINFTPRDGVITINIENEDKAVTVKISDTGNGIPPDDLPFIFNRFYRADKSRASVGTGLGLAITKKILEAHNSDIKVESEIQKGTTFAFELPISQR